MMFLIALCLAAAFSHHVHANDGSAQGPVAPPLQLGTSTGAVNRLPRWMTSHYSSCTRHLHWRRLPSPAVEDSHSDTRWGRRDLRQSSTCPRCGVPHHEPFIPPDSRIVGGIEAKPHSWPWMASLWELGSHQCGGTLIHENWIISAAHCFEGISKTARRWKVVLGSHTQSAKENSQREFLVSKIITHRRYNSYTTQNDIALLKLKKPVTFTKSISVVCIPNDTDKSWDGLRCTTKGWGDTQNRTHSNDALRQVTVPMISSATCKHRAYYGNEFDSKTMLCAGTKEGGKDSCQGDSGGPLVCKRAGEEMWKLAGITSWGYGCAERFKPGVYTHVAKYTKWIKNTMNNYSG